VGVVFVSVVILYKSIILDMLCIAKGELKMRTLRPWTTRELEELKKVTVQAGPCRLGAKAIAQLPQFAHRTVGAIHHAIHYNQLADSARSQAAIRARKLSEAEKSELRQFVQGKGRYWPSPLVGKRFGVSDNTVLRLRRELNLKFTHQECMQCAVYRRWWAKNRQNRRASFAETMKIDRGWIKTELETRRRVIALSNVPKPPRRTCSICGNSWYKTEDFFHRFTFNKKGVGTTSYLSSICLACPRKARRKQLAQPQSP
jgi:hypothetical protein